MLKNVDPLLNPRLLYLLARMGHGDRLAIVDRNYPAYASGVEVNHLAGIDSTEALRALLSVIPLDRFDDRPITFMRASGSEDEMLPVHEAALGVATEIEDRPIGFAVKPRYSFYSEVRRTSVVVATDESRPYGNLIIAKGVL